MNLKAKIFSGLCCAALFGQLIAGEVGVWDFTQGTMPAGATLHSASNQSGFREDVDGKYLHVIPGSHEEYVEFNVAEKANLPQKFTLVAVFRPTGSPGTTMVIGKRYSPQYQLDYTTGGDGTFEFYVGGGDSVKNRAHIGSMPADGRWYHLVAVFDSTAEGENHILYVNGKKVSAIHNSEQLESNVAPLRLAENSELQINSPTGGDWQYAAIYDHAMTAEEALQSYRNSNPGKSGEIKKVDAAVYTVDLDPKNFSAIGGTSRMERFFNRFTGAYEVTAAAAGASVYNCAAGENGSVRFNVSGNVGELHGIEWRNRFPQQLDLSQYGYFYVKVRASGLNRAHTRQAVVSAISSTNVILLNSAELVQDGVYRTYWKKVSLETPVQGIKFSTRSMDRDAFLEIAEVGFARTLEDIPQDQYTPGNFSAGFKPVQIDPAKFNWSLRANLNDRMNEFGGSVAAVDPCISFSSKVIKVNDIPFFVLTNAEKNLVRPSNKSADLRGQKQNILGRNINRNSYQPPSRSDSIFVEVNDRGSELYFLLSSTLPAATDLYAMPAAPRMVTYIEAFQVKLHYADGTVDTAFPFQIKADGYRISGLFGAYMVPLNPAKKLVNVEFVNKIARYDVALAAVTLNNTAKRLYPQAVPSLANNEAPAEVKIAATPCKVAQEGNEVVMENSYYKLVLDFSKGFAVKSIYNKLTDSPVEFAAGSGLAVIANGKEFSGVDGKVENLSVKDNVVSFTLSSIKGVPAKFDLAISGSETAQIKFDASMTTSSDTARVELRFPCFQGLKQGELADNGYLYPQYRNVLTTNEGFCLQPNHRAFTMQFFDLYNEVTGSGLLFMTDNPQQMTTWYGAGKYPNGMTAYIGNKSQELGARANTPVAVCSRSITVHGGSWRRGAQYYREWVATWYKPVNAQNNQKFLDTFFIHVTASAPCDRGLWPFLIDLETKQYDIKAYLDAVYKQFNRKPDMFHFYWWSYRENDARNGEYGERDFDNLFSVRNGEGRKKFKKLIDELQSEDMIVSLYTIWDRYDRDTEFFAKYGEDMVLQRPDGSLDMNQATIYTGVGGPARRNYAAMALNRLVKSVGNDVIYMDVFGTDHEETCINPKCGHRIPSWVAEDDGLFLQRLRRTLTNTAIWSEYPISDINTQYMDGNINYTALPLHAHMAHVYNCGERAPKTAQDLLVPDFYRFSFPRLKQVVFQVGQENFIETWAYMKYNLFNGYALYDTTFWLYFDETRLNLAKTLDIQHDYKDCFTSANPEILVPTLVNGVYANKFPGDGRTVWTVLNGNFTTIEMPVIALEDHQDGDTYFDAWNNVELTPEIKDGQAYVTLRLDPQAVGCIVRKRK